MLMATFSGSNGRFREFLKSILGVNPAEAVQGSEGPYVHQFGIDRILAVGQVDFRPLASVIAANVIANKQTVWGPESVPGGPYE